MYTYGRNALDLSLETLFFFGRQLDVTGVLGVQLCALSEWKEERACVRAYGGYCVVAFAKCLESVRSVDQFLSYDMIL